MSGTSSPTSCCFRAGTFRFGQLFMSNTPCGPQKGTFKGLSAVLSLPANNHFTFTPNNGNNNAPVVEVWATDNLSAKNLTGVSMSVSSYVTSCAPCQTCGRWRWLVCPHQTGHSS